MEIAYLYDFITLTKTSNFMEAAEQLNISQPSLSRHIRILEEDLGMSLFDRSTRSVTLNVYGEKFLPYAKQICELLCMARQDIQDETTEQNNKITIGAIGFTSVYGVLQNISRFIKQFPVFHVSLKEGNTIQLLDLLKKDICDFVFVQNYDQIDKDFIKMPIARDSMIIAMSKDHPLAKEKKLTPDMLKNESFIACKPASVLQNIFEQICREYDFKPQIDFLIDRSETILDLVSHSSCITYAMKKPTLQYRKENLVIREMNPPLETSIVMAYKKDKPLNDAGKAFLSFIKNVFPEA